MGNSIFRRSTANTASAITPRSPCPSFGCARKKRLVAASAGPLKLQHFGQQGLGLSNQKSVQSHTPSPAM